METNFLEIETICVTDKAVTIAANILLKGFNYSEPAYTNIFCEEEQLTDFLLGISNPISMEIFNSVMNKQRDITKTLQIDLHDINKNKPWAPKRKFILEPVDSSLYEFTCYNLIGIRNKID